MRDKIETAKFIEAFRSLPGYKPKGVMSDSSDRQKKRLTEMQLRGEPKPFTTTYDGQSFSNYTRPGSLCFDALFEQSSRKNAPDWFLSSAEIMKRELLGLRPLEKTPINRF